MALYAIVFKNKDNKQVVLSRESDNLCCIFSEYTSAANVLVGIANRLKYLLDGEPEERGNLLLGYRTVRKSVRDEEKEKWERILKTLEIKRVSDMMFLDGTLISRDSEGDNNE